MDNKINYLFRVKVKVLSGNSNMIQEEYYY